MSEADVGGRMSEADVGGRMSEGGCRRSDVGGRKSDDDGWGLERCIPVCFG
jgi:hypothetical protein